MPAPLRLSSTIAGFIGFGLLLAIAAWQPEHRPNHDAYDRCVKHHPQKYCRLTFLEVR